MDPAADAVNVFAIRDKRLTPYIDKGRIALPPGMADDFRATQANAGVSP
ncbi:MAG: hypothetical protein R2712_18305 [Vicinamibacterales bacterium]